MIEKQYDNTNSGVLFKNDQKGNPKRPQYRGSINVAGVDYNISAWIKESKKTGDKFMSLSVEEKKPTAPKQMTEDNWSDPEVPF